MAEAAPAPAEPRAQVAPRAAAAPPEPAGQRGPEAARAAEAIRGAEAARRSAGTGSTSGSRAARGRPDSNAAQALDLSGLRPCYDRRNPNCGVSHLGDAAISPSQPRQPAGVRRGGWYSNPGTVRCGKPEPVPGWSTTPATRTSWKSSRIETYTPHQRTGPGIDGLARNLQKVTRYQTSVCRDVSVRGSHVRPARRSTRTTFPRTEFTMRTRTHRKPQRPLVLGAPGGASPPLHRQRRLGGGRGLR